MPASRHERFFHNRSLGDSPNNQQNAGDQSIVQRLFPDWPAATLRLGNAERARMLGKFNFVGKRRTFRAWSDSSTSGARACCRRELAYRTYEVPLVRTR